MSKKLDHQYVLHMADGEPLDPGGIYFVLKLNSGDPERAEASQAAAVEYAMEIKDADPQLFRDLTTLVRQIRRGENLSSQSVFQAEPIN